MILFLTFFAATSFSASYTACPHLGHPSSNLGVDSRSGGRKSTLEKFKQFRTQLYIHGEKIESSSGKKKRMGYSVTHCILSSMLICAAAGPLGAMRAGMEPEPPYPYPLGPKIFP